MPLTTIASYLSTIDEFSTHWTQWNTTTGANNALTGNFKVSNLSTMRSDLQTAITAVETPRNARQTAGNDRDIKKGPLLERLRQFRSRVIGDLAGSTYVGSLPTQPVFQCSEGVFMRAMDDMQTLWVAINANPPSGFSAPLLLVGGFTAANHATAIAALRTTYTTLNTAAQTVELRISDRNILLGPIRQRLVQYRTVIQGQFAAGDTLILSLPRVSPLPGSTPHATVLTAVWNDTTSMLDLSWEPSSRPDLKNYQLRSCDPPRYRTQDETPVHTFPENVTSGSLSGGAVGLGTSGASKIFCMYVVTDDDNEKGSNKPKIVRP